MAGQPMRDAALDSHAPQVPFGSEHNHVVMNRGKSIIAAWGGVGGIVTHERTVVKRRRHQGGQQETVDLLHAGISTPATLPESEGGCNHLMTLRERKEQRRLVKAVAAYDALDRY